VKTTEEKIFIADTILEMMESLNVKPDAVIMMLTLDDDGIGCHVQNPHLWPMKLKQTICLALLSVMKEVQESMNSDEEETMN
jgi:hypothetical protein